MSRVSIETWFQARRMIGAYTGKPISVPRACACEDDDDEDNRGAER